MDFERFLVFILGLLALSLILHNVSMILDLQKKFMNV
jgi:hypothetical protein